MYIPLNTKKTLTILFCVNYINAVYNKVRTLYSKV